MDSADFLPMIFSVYLRGSLWVNIAALSGIRGNAFFDSLPHRTPMGRDALIALLAALGRIGSFRPSLTGPALSFDYPAPILVRGMDLHQLVAISARRLYFVQSPSTYSPRRG